MIYKDEEIEDENSNLLDKFTEDKPELDFQSNNDISKTSESYTDIIDNKVFQDISEEAFTPILPTSIKMGRLFKLRSSSNSFNKSNIMLKIFRGMAFIPIVTTSEQVSNEVKFAFGDNLYSRMLFNYIMPKKFRYKNTLLPGSKMTITLQDLREYSDHVKRTLPKLQNIASFYIRNNKNTIFDYSVILNKSWPSKAVLMRANVLPTAENIILQMIYRMIFGGVGKDETNFLPLYTQYETTLPSLSPTFTDYFISIPILSKNSLIPNLYLNPVGGKVPNSIKKNVDDSMAFGIARFIVDLLDQNTFDGSLLKQKLAENIKSKRHFIFFLHNDMYGFYVDPSEFFEKNLKFETIFRLIKTSMKSLIALNANKVDSISLDNAIGEEVSDEEIEDSVNKAVKVDEEVKDEIEETISKPAASETKHVKVSEDEDEAKTVKQTKDKQKEETKTLLTINKNLKKTKDLYNSNLDSSDDELFKEEKEFSEDLDDLEIPEIEDDIELDDVLGEEDDASKNISDTTQFMDDLANSKDTNFKKTLVEEANAQTKPKLSAKEEARIEVLKNKYKTIEFDDNRTLKDILEDTKTMQIDVNKSSAKILDDSFNFSLLKDMTDSYVNKTMAHDMVNIVKSFSEDKSINMHIIDFKKADVSDQFNDLEMYTFNLEDENKKKHKIQFKFPKVDKDGFMHLNGNRKYLKNQWILKPVTKTNADEVYLVSDYNKTHIFRQGNALNKNTIVLKKLLQDIIKNSEKFSKSIVIIKGDNSSINKDYITTIEYDDLATTIDKLIIYPNTPKQIVFYFNQSEIRKEINTLNLPYVTPAGRMPICIEGEHNIIDVDVLDSSDSVAGKILDIIESTNVFPNFRNFVNNTTIPKRKMLTKIELQSKTVPLIVFLSALFKFSTVLTASKSDTFFVPNKEKIPEDKLDHIEDYIFTRFKDGKFYYNQYPIDNALLFNGLAEMDVDNINYLDGDLDDLGTYLDYIYDAFKTRNLYKGWTSFRELFITPITKEILRDLKQPTEFLELFLYANSLLSDNSYTPSNDLSNYRIRNYEILNTFLYQSISESYRTYKQRGRQRFAFTIPEDDVLKKLNKNFVLENYDATNPLNELRARSSITYKGPQGINSDRAFKLDRRGNTLSTVGTVGISGLENGNVGIVRQLTMSPKIISTRGYLDVPKDQKDVQNISSSSLLTAEEAIVPYITHDDPKRIGFTSAQTKHVIPAENFDVPVVGTGFEQTVLNKISDDFGYKAKDKGVVTALDETNKFIVIKYADGTSDRVDYGNKYIRNSDFFLGNNIEPNVKVGASVKKGDIITYNKDFFKKAMGKLIFTQGCLARVAILEGEVTEEDSSAITEHLADKLTGTVVKRKQIAIGHSANIVKVAKIGDFVRYGDPILLYEDQKNEDADMSLLALLGDTDENVLNTLTRHNGEANYTGTICDIKVYWTVDPDQMGESCKKFVKQYISNLKKQIEFEEKSTGVPSSRRHEVEVSTPFGTGNRINGVEINKEGGILIEFYIRHTQSKRPGDKLTFNSALKSVITQVIPEEMSPYRITDSKFKRVDSIFSLLSVDNRMVCSPFFTGYLGKIVFEYGKRAASEFLNDIK